MLRGAYTFITDLGGPALRLWLGHRARIGKEDRARLPERLGVASLPRPQGRLVWFHAASVGESLSILPVISNTLQRGAACLVTTGTRTSAALMSERLPEGAVHQFVPLDRRAWIKRFLNHWKPDAAVWTESELWPNSLFEIAAHRIPLALINARLSDKTYKGWRRWPGFARSITECFSVILAQSEEDARRFTELGGQNVHAAGNLKFSSAPLPVDPAQLSAIRSDIARRPLWLASSIHPGEDTIVAEAHRLIAESFPDLLTLVIPRHPERGPAMAATMKGAGLQTALRSSSEPISSGTQVYIADTMGELGLFYRLSEVVFMGKSLAVGGGQNPLEPAQAGCALLFGPDMSNFREASAELLSEGAAKKVRDASELADAVVALLHDTAARNDMIAAAKAVVERHGNALDITLGHLEPYVSQTSS